MTTNAHTAHLLLLTILDETCTDEICTDEIRTAVRRQLTIEGCENIDLDRLIVLRRGVEFEACCKMLATRVGGGAIRLAKRKFGLPSNAKPDEILAILDAAIAEAQGR